MQALSRHAGTTALLIGLLVVFFVLMSWQANRASTISVVETTVQTVISPVHRMVSSIWLGMADTWRRYVGLVGASSRAATLQRRNAVLEHQRATLEAAARENARLRQLLELERSVEIPSMAAETIGRDIANGYQALTLNRGSRDGVQHDSPVVAPNGALVGRIVRVSPWTSTVQLITDPESAVGVRDVRSGAAGVLHGNGGPTLEMAYVPTLEDVEEGDIIVTSGDDGLYPAGVEVGRVDSAIPGSPVPGSPRVPLARDETALFLDVALEALVDMTRVDQVLILAPVDNGG